MLDFLNELVPLKWAFDLLVKQMAKLFSEALAATLTRGIRIRKAWAAHAQNVFVSVYSRRSTVFVY
jgi:hypothetical protein